MLVNRKAPEMLTVYARAGETQTRGALRDDKAVELVNRLDYDFSRAEADKAMRSG